MLFEQYQKKLNNYIVRSAVSKGGEQIYKSKYINDAIDYFNSANIHSQIKLFMKKRFGVAVDNQVVYGGELEEQKTLSRTPPSYRRTTVHDAIDLGLIETVNSRVGCRIASILANLFTPKTSRWTYTSENSKYSVEEVDSLMGSLRDKGNMISTLLAADYTSCAIGTGAMRIDWQAGSPVYSVIAPNDIVIQYSETVKDSDDNVRISNTGSIEDALAICIRVSSHEDYDYWVAYVGRNDEYEDGRMVTYKVDSNGDPRVIPPVGYNETYDYKIDGSVCNPLTWIQNRNPELTNTEYPIVLLHGGYSRISNSLLDITTDLFETSLELELALSRLIKAVGSGTVGIRALSNISNMPIPECLEGSIVLQDGQDIKSIDTANGIRPLVEACKAVASQICQGYAVPIRLVLGQEGQQPSSGLAIVTEMQPMQETRNLRIAENKESISRVFDIEKGLLAFHEDIFLTGIYGHWNPGDLIIPRTEEEKLLGIEKRRSLGLSDIIADVKDYYEYESEEDAINHLEKMKNRASKFGIAKAPILPERAPRE